MGTCAREQSIVSIRHENDKSSHRKLESMRNKTSFRLFLSFRLPISIFKLFFR